MSLFYIWLDLPQTTSLTFPFEKAQNIALTDGSLNVTDDGSATHATGVVHEFDTDLSDITGVSGPAKDTVNLCELDWLILLCISACREGDGIRYGLERDTVAPVFSSILWDRGPGKSIFLVSGSEPVSKGEAVSKAGQWPMGHRTVSSPHLWPVPPPIVPNAANSIDGSRRRYAIGRRRPPLSSGDTSCHFLDQHPLPRSMAPTPPLPQPRLPPDANHNRILS